MMSYFLVQRTEWRLVEAADQLQAIRSFDKATRMHAETEAISGTGTLRGPINASTWDEAWDRAHVLLYGER